MAITWPYVRPTVRLHHRHTNVKEIDQQVWHPKYENGKRKFIFLYPWTVVSLLSKVSSLDYLSCPQTWSIEQKKVGGRPAKLNEKKGDRDLEREIKNKGDIFLLEEQHENFVTAVTKWEMLAATNARCRCMRGSEKKGTRTRTALPSSGVDLKMSLPQQVQSTLSIFWI